MQMKYNIVITWNGSICLNGRCTAVMARDILLNFYQNNFVGDISRDAEMFVPSVADIIALKDWYHKEVQDDSGQSRFTIQAI
jgi:hypothetical protein